MKNLLGAYPLHAFLDRAHRSTLRELDRGETSARAAFKTVVRAQANLKPERRLVPWFDQFVFASWALEKAHREGDLTSMGDWIGWALSNEVEDVHVANFELARLVLFRRARSIAMWDLYVPTMMVFFSGFYHYARCRTAMKAIGEELWPVALDIFHTCLGNVDTIQEIEAFLAVSMLTWASKESPERARDLTPVLEGLVSDQRFQPRIRAVFCTGLATNGGRFSTLTPQEWAQRCLSEFSEYISTEARLQMQVAVLDIVTSPGEVEAFLEAVRDHQSRPRSKENPLQFSRTAAYRIDAITPFFVKCLRGSRSDLLLRGLQDWYQEYQSSTSLDPQTVLITVPFGEVDFCAVFNGQKVEIIRDNQALLERLTHETNQFLGIARTIAYADNSALELPARPGIPATVQQDGLFKILHESFCPVGAVPAAGATCQLMLPAEAYPIQGTQLQVWGQTWPIAASLSTPLPDRPTLKIVIWSGGQSLTEAMETEMVAHAFSSRGFEVISISPSTCGNEVFLETYIDLSIDILWIVSHGEFDHWSPENVKLQIAPNGDHVTLDDLWMKAPDGPSRRLLMLNVCDGARFSEIGMLPRIGLAAGLACQSQATISHLWPVMGFPSAVFGAYLAHFLSTQIAFFEAYQASMVAIRKDTNTIAAELREFYQDDFELLRRLDARNEDYAPIEFSGSAAFFQ